MTHPFLVVGRVASLLVVRYRNRRTFFLVQQWSGESSLKGTKKLFALKDSWRELCRKPEVFFYERIRKYKGESAWVGLASFIGSLDLGEEGEESSHRTCSATLRVGEHSDQHTCSPMRTLTYPVGRKLMTFTSTKQLVVALRATIEGLVFCF